MEYQKKSFTVGMPSGKEYRDNYDAIDWGKKEVVPMGGKDGLIAKMLGKDERPTVTLRFETDADKRYFMGQLSDGFGENECDLDWPWQSGVEFHDATVFDVKVFKDRY